VALTIQSSRRGFATRLISGVRLRALMHDEVAKGFVAVARFIAYQIIWSLVLFNIGRASLLLVTLGQHPRGADCRRHSDRISLVGMLVLVLAWLVIAFYNNAVGIHA